MGCEMAVDANVFLLASKNIGCAKVTHRSLYSCDDMLIVDKDRHIIEEYKTYAKKYPESRLRKLVIDLIEKTISDTIREAKDRLFQSFLPLECKIQPVDYPYSKDSSSAEPYYFGVTHNQKHAYLVIPDLQPDESDFIQRGYRVESIEQLRSRFPNINIVTTADTSWLSAPEDPAPKTLDSLQAFLEKYSLDKNHPERSFIELKCPENPDAGLSKHIFREVMEAICGFSNSTNGYIFVGVRETKTGIEMPGIACKYNDNGLKSLDDFSQIINSASGFKPAHPITYQWWIPKDDKKEKWFLVIRVQRLKETTTLSYNGDVWRRIGTSTLKYPFHT